MPLTKGKRWWKSRTKVEAQSLAEEVGSYLICTVVWYDILHLVNHVSKFLQSLKMQLDVAVDFLTKARTSLITEELALLQHRPLLKTCEEMNCGGCAKR